MKDKEWIQYFKHTVAMARNTRLAGEIDAALRWDTIVEAYYKDANSAGWTEMEMFEIETNVRGKTAQ